ncbi:MAG: hypothetical protein QXU74_01865 [Candidatus Aenigmatarchaeota archaeon]
MELTLSTVVIIIVAMCMILLTLYFYSKIKESGTSTLTQILNVPEFLKKMFGGT